MCYMKSQLLKLVYVVFMAIAVLLIVAIFPIITLAGRGVIGSGIFTFLSHEVVNGLVIYTFLATFLFAKFLKFDTLYSIVLSITLTALNFSILVIDGRLSKYAEWPEKYIFENFGGPESILLKGFILAGISLIILIVLAFKLALNNTLNQDATKVAPIS